MGYRFKDFLNEENVVRCKFCLSDLTSKSYLVSKKYQGKLGKACLYRKVINTIEGKSDKRSMTTGVYVVRDVKCAICNKYIGWKYIVSYSPDQEFKQGKYIIETLAVKRF